MLVPWHGTNYRNPKYVLYNVPSAISGDSQYWQTGQYSSTGLYLGTNSVDGLYLGDFLKIEFPSPFQMTSWAFVGPPGGWTHQGVGKYKMYGRMNYAETWTLLHFQNVFPGDSATITMNPDVARGYTQYAFCVNSLAGNSAVLGIEQ